ncbi:Ribosomal RNA methyltransferase RrmJ/FtsJ [Macrophomina phaseolina MS6]|uniref:rRNA methyltransferase 2, mitochondrial n=1 Tax=Macrophomina phaseolina (strain MS6) TaxID=1126212 RepID=K2S213_MACPH|nr:Ribosomal RNA methyltransferase RrmJ/FtsJ [Macrophomina phaseolina MS6]
MLSSRLIRQLADSALLGRTLPSPCCRRTFSQCALTCRTAIASPPPVAAVHRHDSRPTTSIPTRGSARAASSSTRWKSRQGRDRYAKEAKVRGLKSRAAFKLLEMNQRYRLFRPGATVVDLGYAPGSWSQVAIDRTQPGGRVIGIDVIPAQPPRGVSTIQGNFLSEAVQAEVRAMMNTSGMAFRDHAGSMDLCHAALTFAFDTLRTGGNFVCKFYQGAEDKALEKKLRRMFEKVFREKPESSRSESKEAFFVALKRRPDPSKEEVFREN